MARAIVVGAGYIGLTTALELSDAGWTVSVFDPAPATGATHAAAGMLAPAAEVVWGQDPLYSLMIQSASLYTQFASRITELGAEPDYRPGGTLVVALDSADRQALDDLAQLQDRLGLDAIRVTGSQARRLEPALAPGVVGGVHLPHDGWIDPRRASVTILDHLGDRVRRIGARSLWRCDGRTVGVELVDGTREAADQVVVCTGLGAIEGLPALPLRPIHGDIIRLRVPERAHPLVRGTVRGLVRGRPAYLVPRSDGTLVLGATVREDGEDGVSTEGVHRLLDDARRLVPGVVDTTFLEVVARARPATPDDAPILDRIDDGLVLSTGYFRHGILLAPLAARLAAGLLAGAQPDEDLTRALAYGRFSADRESPGRPTTLSDD